MRENESIRLSLSCLSSKTESGVCSSVGYRVTIGKSGVESTEESDWEKRLKISNTACLLISRYYGALRGEELNRVHLGMIRANWSESTGYTPACHVPLMLVGRFKKCERSSPVLSTIGDDNE